MTLNKTMLKKYKKNPYRCPYCGSENLDGGRFDQVTGSTGVVPINCLNCKKEWDDLYELVGVDDQLFDSAKDTVIEIRGTIVTNVNLGNSGKYWIIYWDNLEDGTCPYCFKETGFTNKTSEDPKECPHCGFPLSEGKDIPKWIARHQ